MPAHNNIFSGIFGDLTNLQWPSLWDNNLTALPPSIFPASMTTSSWPASGSGRRKGLTVGERSVLRMAVSVAVVVIITGTSVGRATSWAG